MNTTKSNLVERLRNTTYAHKKMIIGFDGFIDEIIHAVDKRMDSEHFTRIETMLQFAKRIERAAGLSTNIELIPVQEKIGGNGPIMCNALSQHDSDMVYIGALGQPQIHPVFLGMPSNAKLYSIAQAAHTDAVEFLDGKLMLGKMTCLNDVTYANIIKTVGQDNFVKMLAETDLFATVNWSMLPYMTDLWQKIQEDLLPLLPKRSNPPIFFVDLADPEKREHHEIKRALDLLKSFNHHFKVVLGLNKKEAYDIASILGLASSDASLEVVNRKLYDYLKIYAVVIHPVDQSCTVIDGTFYHDMGPLAKKPKLTTGAGDNFNAGFVFGLMLGLSPHESLLMGMGTSGFYVRQARSPKFFELVQFIADWDHNQID
jgi:hypothetical protein